MEKVIKTTATTPPMKTASRLEAHIPIEPILNPPLKVKKFPKPKSALYVTIALVVVAALLGVGSGWVVAKKGTSSAVPGQDEAGVVTKNSVSNSSEAGIDDSEQFPDTAEGILQEGGISGEGTHHLDRGLGEEKYVYLSSTVINLQNFVGKKVEVHGQTISGKKAGWLMDVGKIKVIK